MTCATLQIHIKLSGYLLSFEQIFDSNTRSIQPAKSWVNRPGLGCIFQTQTLPQIGKSSEIFFLFAAREKKFARPAWCQQQSKSDRGEPAITALCAALLAVCLSWQRLHSARP